VGIGHARIASAGRAFGPSTLRMTGRASSSGQRSFQRATAAAVGTQHAVPDIRSAARQRKHPGVSGEQVALEDDPEALVVVDAVEVLTYGVPLAEIPRRVRFERPAN